MKNLFKLLTISVLAVGFTNCNQAQQKVTQESTQVNSIEKKDQFYLTENGDSIFKVHKSDADWKAELSEIEFYVLREAGTERAGTGDLLKIKKKGVYTCGGCQFPLFSSETKFDSGTGWPSFYAPLNTHCVQEDTDYKIGYARTEVLCKRCDGHLGHVFPDGPQPTGLRYCINSVSLDFVEE